MEGREGASEGGRGPREEGMRGRAKREGGRERGREGENGLTILL